MLHASCAEPSYAACWRGFAQQAWSGIQPSQIGTPHTGQRTEWAWHPALPPHSAQARAIAPHSIACSPIGSTSGTTEKSHRSCLAGMAQNYTPSCESNVSSETSIWPAREIHLGFRRGVADDPDRLVANCCG